MWFPKVNNNGDCDFQDGNLLILLDSHMESVVSEINLLIQKRPKCPNTKFQTITSQEKKTRRKTISGTARNPLQKYLEKSGVFKDSIVVERVCHLRELPHVHNIICTGTCSLITFKNIAHRIPYSGISNI